MSQAASEEHPRFALCIQKGAEDDLEVRKAYKVLPPALNESGFLRVVDESGEDYLYPAENFLFIDVPQSVEEVLLRAA